MSLLSEVMAKVLNEVTTPVSTTIIADNDTAPTNWQTVFTYTSPTLPGSATTKYQMEIDGTWKLNSVAKAALFRVIINGAPSERLLIEPKDADELKGEYIRSFVTHTSDGVINIELQFLISDAGAGTPTLVVNSADCTLERFTQ